MPYDYIVEETGLLRSKGDEIIYWAYISLDDAVQLSLPIVPISYGRAAPFLSHPPSWRYMAGIHLYSFIVMM